MLAVAVGVVPDAIAELGKLVESGVNVGVVLAGGQGDRGALTGGVDVAVGRGVSALVLATDDVARRGDDGNAVGARGNGEAVVAVGVRGHGLHDRARAVLELYRDTGQTQFACVLHAVGVGVQPYAVTQGGVRNFRQRHVKRNSVGRQVQIVTTATIRTASVSHLKIKSDDTTGIQWRDISQFACNDIRRKNLLSSKNGNAPQG